jgi:hypothetical protein
MSNIDAGQQRHTGQHQRTGHNRRGRRHTAIGAAPATTELRGNKTASKRRSRGRCINQAVVLISIPCRRRRPAPGPARPRLRVRWRTCAGRTEQNESAAAKARGDGQRGDEPLLASGTSSCCNSALALK